MSKYTPGPWTICLETQGKKDVCRIVDDETGFELARITGPEVLTVVRRIAWVDDYQGINPEAVGEMLEALKELEQEFHQELARFDDDWAKEDV